MTYVNPIWKVKDPEADGLKKKTKKTRKIFKSGETTPNVLKAKARKRRNRELQEIAEQGEAEILKISVFELRYRKFLEVLRIIKASVVVVSKPPKKDNYWW